MQTPVKTRLVEVVVPVYNEQRALRESIVRLHGYLTRNFPYGFRITIADNASTDGTWHEARSLAAELSHVRAVHLDAKRSLPRSSRSAIWPCTTCSWGIPR